MSGLAVDTLRLGQFRSYDAGLLSPEGASVALYGPNGAGNTNVLEAVSLLAPGRGLRRAGGEELARKPGDHGWRVRAELTTHKGAIEVVTGAQGGPRTVEIDGKA
ncbi:MAG: DNA replication and repair protein RecF, partial [Pseudomonadota bacterium]